MTSQPTWTKRALVRAVLAAAFVACLLAATGRTQEQDLDVLKVIPQNYKLVLENQFIRVIEARIPPGTKEPPHRHLRGVSVSMSDYTIEHQAHEGGSWQRSQRKLGSVYWSESSVHRTRNAGGTPSHTIRIELKF